MPIIGRAIRGTSITLPGNIWLPKLRDKVYSKIEIVDSNNVTWNVTSDSFTPSFTWTTLRYGTGNFNLVLNNFERKYLNRFKEGDVVKFYGDWTNGTTQIFQAKMEEPRYGFENGWKCFINGMKNPELTGVKFTKSYTNAQAKNVLQDVLDIKFPGQFTYTNIDTNMTTNISPKYEGESVVNVLKDILERAGYDGYIDIDNDVHTFVETGILNTNETIIQGQNVLNISPFGKDTLKQRNKVKLYGAVVENCPIIKSSEITTTSWNKEEIVRQGSSTTLIDASERVSTTLSKLNQIKKEGSITISALSTLKPGDKIEVRIPNANIEGQYFIIQYTHTFSSDGGWITDVNINKLVMNLFSIHFEHKEKEETRELDNPNDMKNTLILLTFDNENDIASLSGCHISDGKLVLDSGIDTGIMVSNTKTNTNNFTSVELRGIANDDFIFGPSIMYISNDGGSTYKIIDNFKELISLTSSGKSGVVKVTIKSDGTYANPSLDSIGLLVST